MKAIQVQEFGGPEVLQVKEISKPAYSANQVRVRLYAAGINPNDLYTLGGQYAFYQPDLPYTPGFDGAGVIEAVGSKVTDWQVGDKVVVAAFTAAYHTGTFAQYMVASTDALFPLPEGVTYEAAASIGIPATIAYHALVKGAQTRPGEIVFIHGASGGVGSFAVQIAKWQGAKVIGSSGSQTGRQGILDRGADAAVAHLDAGREDLLVASQGQGPDVIIEMLADQNLDKDLAVLAPFGRVVIIGARGPVTIHPRLLMAKEAQIKGVAGPNLTKREFREIMAALTDLIVQGHITPLVSERYDFEEIPALFSQLLTKAGNGNRVLLMP